MTEPIARDPVISGVVLTDQASAPVAPGPGKRKLFVDPAGVLKLEDPNGVVTPVGQGGLPAAHHTTHEPGGSDPLAVDAAAATGSLRTLGTGASQAAPGNDARFGSGGPPTGAAGGDLTGTYPNPQIAAGVITDADVNAANKDGAAGTPSLRTLGAGASQAAGGTHTHGAAAPAAHATTHQPGGADAMAVDAAAGTGSLRTLSTTATSAAPGNHAHAGMVTNPMTTAADLIVGGASGTPARLGVGSATQVLTVVGGVLTWATPASGGMTNPMTASDDVIKGGASGTPVRMAKGADGTVLTVVGGVLTWQAPAAPGISQAAADTRYVNTTGDTMTGPLLFSADDTQDIGAFGATRPRTLYVASSIKVGEPGLYFDRWSMVASNVYRIGTNTADAMSLATADTTRWTVTATGHLVAAADNTYDVGAAGAVRPRTVYAATAFVGPGALPTGGGAGQVLGKVDGTDYNAAWSAPPAVANMLTNPGAEIWQRGNGPFTAQGAYTADRWQLSLGTGSTASVVRDTTNFDPLGGGEACIAVTYTQATTNVSRLINSAGDYYQLRGRTVTFSCRVRTATANAVRVGVWDGTYHYGAYHSGSGAYETLTHTCTVPGNGLLIQCLVALDASCTAYVDNAVLVVGSSAPPYNPLRPADDLDACLRYYQVWGGTSTFEYFAAGQCYSTTRAQLILPYQAPMGGVPTPTVSAPGDFSLANAAGTPLTVTAIGTASAIGLKSIYLDATVASGLVAGDATILAARSTAAARIALEWNP